MAEATSTSGTDQQEKSLQKTPGEVVTRWLRELESADAHEKDWREQATKVIALYKDDEKKKEQNEADFRFNILFSNTEVLKGALYSQCPAPDVRRRFLDKDDTGRIAALVLTRAVIAQLDKQTDGEDFDSVMKDSVSDMVLPGRASARVKYVPTMGKSQKRVPVELPGQMAMPMAGDADMPMEGMEAAPMGAMDPDAAQEGAEPPGMPEGVEQDEQGYFRTEEVDEVVYECVSTEYIEWAFFRMSPAKRWRKVRWVAWGELLTRDDLIAQFGDKIGKAVELKWMPAGMDDNEENAIFKRALVWTIWNKTDRKVYVISKGYKEAPLAVKDDPLRLEQFFPVPRPLYSIVTTDSLIPVPEYAVYQEHAMQLDAINERIAVLTDALRRRGVYDAAVEELQELAKAPDNKFVPVKDYRAFVEKGGLNGAFQELDISNLATVLKELSRQADAKKAQIYEIIGIADIMRGASKANETLGAQQIKNQWGAIRIQPRQMEVQRYARDLIRIMAEIIAEHFSPQTLATMTGIQLAFTAQERDMLMQTAPDDPRAKRPTWDDIMQVLRSDKLRGFKVDIETDSTIRARADEEQKNRADLISSLTGFLKEALPAVQQGMIPKKVAGELMMFGVRAFPAGPQLEEVLDEWINGGVMGDKQEGQDDPMKQAATADQMAQMQHGNEMRGIEKETATANMVAAKAKAYQEITKGEGMAPGMQLDLLAKQAKLDGIIDPQAQTDPGQPQPGDTPMQGAMVQ